MIGAIVQARMNSRRLPGKVIKEVRGKPLLFYPVERLSRSKLLEKIVIATGRHPSDDMIAQYSFTLGVEVFRGSEEDVLDRYYQAAKKFGIDIVVRITADCPLIDPEIVDNVIAAYTSGKDFDLVRTGQTYPEGLDAEVFSLKSLEIAWKEARLKSEREHVTAYLWKNPASFKVVSLQLPADLSSLRVTVDEDVDFQVVKLVLENLYKEGDIFYLKDILRLREEKPEIFKLNQHIMRNEGYLKSLAEEDGANELAPRGLTGSEKYWQRAIQLIPAGTQTFSKGPSQYVDGVAPKYLAKGKGSHVWDVDGNEFIDYGLGLGAVTLGYGYSKVNEAIKRQLEDGPTFSLMHPLEVEVSEKLVELIPCAEMVRFGKNGSDVTSGAVRAARAFTGREKIICCGYHGWQDWYIGSTTRAKGVPESTRALTLTFEYNDLPGLEKLFSEHPGEIAAVIIEAIAIEEPAAGFLESVKDLTHRHGALLIFDEIVNGFRIAIGGAQEYFGIVPDMATFGKGMANGMPLAAVVGRREVMREFDEIFYSFTFGGETVSLAAGLVTMEVYETEPVIDHFRKQGQKLKDGYNALAEKHGLAEVTGAYGLPAHSAVFFRPAGGHGELMIKSLWQQELIKEGILTIGVHNLCLAHSDEDILATLSAYDQVLAVLKEALDSGDLVRRLEGEPIQPIFRRW